MPYFDFLKKYPPIAVVLTASILATLLWRILPGQLSDRSIVLSGPIEDISFSFFEGVKYLLISGVLSFSLLYPLYLSDIRQKKRSFQMALLVFSLVFLVLSYYLNFNLKGLKLVRYFGDDFPFIFRIFYFFALFPIIIFNLLNKVVYDVRNRTVWSFYGIGIIVLLLCHLEDGRLLYYANFKEYIAKGHFLFWYGLLFGVYAIFENKYQEQQEIAVLQEE